MRYVFQLFVTGRGRDSIAAFQRARAFCEKYLAGRYQLWVVNVLLQPELVPSDVIATPTLVRVRPGERRQAIGDLGDEERLRSFFVEDTAETEVSLAAGRLPAAEIGRSH